MTTPHAQRGPWPTAPAPARIETPEHALTVSVAYLDDAINALRDRRDLLAILARAHGDIYQVSLQPHRERVAENVTQELQVLAHLAPDDPRLIVQSGDTP